MADNLTVKGGQSAPQAGESKTGEDAKTREQAELDRLRAIAKKHHGKELNDKTLKAIVARRKAKIAKTQKLDETKQEFQSNQAKEKVASKATERQTQARQATGTQETRGPTGELGAKESKQVRANPDSGPKLPPSMDKATTPEQAARLLDKMFSFVTVDGEAFDPKAYAETIREKPPTQPKDQARPGGKQTGKTGQQTGPSRAQTGQSRAQTAGQQPGPRTSQTQSGQRSAQPGQTPGQRTGQTSGRTAPGQTTRTPGQPTAGQTAMPPNITQSSAAMRSSGQQSGAQAGRAPGGQPGAPAPGRGPVAMGPETTGRGPTLSMRTAGASSSLNVTSPDPSSLSGGTGVSGDGLFNAGGGLITNSSFDGMSFNWEAFNWFFTMVVMKDLHKYRREMKELRRQEARSAIAGMKLKHAIKRMRQTFERNKATVAFFESIKDAVGTIASKVKEAQAKDEAGQARKEQQETRNERIQKEAELQRVQKQRETAQRARGKEQSSKSTGTNTGSAKTPTGGTQGSNASAGGTNSGGTSSGGTSSTAGASSAPVAFDPVTAALAVAGEVIEKGAELVQNVAKEVAQNLQDIEVDATANSGNASSPEKTPEQLEQEIEALKQKEEELQEKIDDLDGQGREAEGRIGDLSRMFRGESGPSSPEEFDRQFNEYSDTVQGMMVNAPVMPNQYLEQRGVEMSDDLRSTLNDIRLHGRRRARILNDQNTLNRELEQVTDPSRGPMTETRRARRAELESQLAQKEQELSVEDARFALAEERLSHVTDKVLLHESVMMAATSMDDRRAALADANRVIGEADDMVEQLRGVPEEERRTREEAGLPFNPNDDPPVKESPEAWQARADDLRKALPLLQKAVDEPDMTAAQFFEYARTLPGVEPGLAEGPPQEGYPTPAISDAADRMRIAGEMWRNQRKDTGFMGKVGEITEGASRIIKTIQKGTESAVKAAEDAVDRTIDTSINIDMQARAECNSILRKHASRSQGMVNQLMQLLRMQRSM